MDAGFSRQLYVCLPLQLEKYVLEVHHWSHLSAHVSEPRPTLRPCIQVTCVSGCTEISWYITRGTGGRDWATGGSPFYESTCPAPSPAPFVAPTATPQTPLPVPAPTLLPAPEPTAELPCQEGCPTNKPIPHPSRPPIPRPTGDSPTVTPTPRPSQPTAVPSLVPSPMPIVPAPGALEILESGSLVPEPPVIDGATTPAHWRSRRACHSGTCQMYH